jgi:RHS repeat-associated protein
MGFQSVRYGRGDEIRIITPTASSIIFGFRASINDDEIGLHYNYYRHYDSHTGRYAQSDPIGLAGALNTYLYTDGNPHSEKPDSSATPLRGSGSGLGR